jgi:hypothetical protein
MLLTRSSTATFLDFHTNSHTAITHATPMPPIRTTNTPPTLARPSSLAVLLVFVVSSCKTIAQPSKNNRQKRLTLHAPPPRFSFHQRVFRMWSLPSSCSFNIAPLIAVRNGESGRVNRHRKIESIGWKGVVAKKNNIEEASEFIVSKRGKGAAGLIMCNGGFGNRTGAVLGVGYVSGVLEIPRFLDRTRTFHIHARLLNIDRRRLEIQSVRCKSGENKKIQIQMFFYFFRADEHSEGEKYSDLATRRPFRHLSPLLGGTRCGTI